MVWEEMIWVRRAAVSLTSLLNLHTKLTLGSPCWAVLRDCVGETDHHQAEDQGHASEYSHNDKYLFL